MSAATIVFIDIVGFSKKPTSEQRRLVGQLTVEVLHELHGLLHPPMQQPSLLALPTGDGMALSFLHTPNREWSAKTLLSLIVRLHRWAHSEHTDGGEVELRVGVHVGVVELTTDINGRTNVCGNTINYAQRVMDAANGRQTLFSEAAFAEHVGVENATMTGVPALSGLEFRLLGPIEVFAKHKLRIPVYKLTVEPGQDWYRNEDPEAKHLLLVSLTPSGTPLFGPFAGRLKAASQIALVQLTGSRLADRLGGELPLSPNLERLWVFMPSPTACERLGLPENPPEQGRVTPSLIQAAIEKWKSKLLEIKAKQATPIDIKLGVFETPPYFGGSFVNWERPGGTIHVSPYVWNIPAPRCPGFDFQWLGAQPSEAYQVYVEGLRFLDAQTTNALGDGG